MYMNIRIKIDEPLLKQQKDTLINVINKADKKDVEDLDGILNMIDAIQDEIELNR